jgi:uncharacterized SAM-binding protein YcdF (DUF218 family)
MPSSYLARRSSTAFRRRFFRLGSIPRSIYLVDRGVPADAILMENVSHNTAASFEGVRSILRPRGVESLLVVSDGFHLYRSKMLAEDAGFEAYSYAAENSPIGNGSGTELRYLIRETFAVLAWKLHLSR